MAEALPWYHGRISTNEAMKICTMIGENGAFLLRDSQREQEAFTLSVFYKLENGDEVYHYRIKKTPGKKLFLKIMKKEFISWDELIQFCKTTQECEHFPQPLVRAIEKSLVADWDRNDTKWRKSFVRDNRKPEIKKEAVATKPKGYKKIPSPRRITEFFRKKTKPSSTKEKEECESVDHNDNEDYEEWDDFTDSEDDTDDSSEFTSGDKCVAKSDSSEQENEMDFKTGDEMRVQATRTDGWLYCLNETRKTNGWVNKCSLKKC